MSGRLALASSCVAVLIICSPARADAQLYVAGYLGASHTPPATVAIDAPAVGLSVRYDDVQFEGRSFEFPLYYGVRIGGLLGSERRFGIEVEFIHLKVYAKTDRAPMNGTVQRYAMSHGLNFLLVNLVSRRTLTDGPVSLVARIGGGPTLPHAETTILGQVREQYEYAGLGGHAAVGFDVQLRAKLSAVAEYKFTYAKPRITLAAGTGETTSRSHQVAFGLAFGLSR